MRKTLRTKSLIVLVAVLGAITPVGADITAREGDQLPLGMRLRRQKDPRAFTFRHAYIQLAIQKRAARVNLMARGPSDADVIAAAADIAVAGERSVPVFPVVFANTGKPPYDRSALQNRLFGAGPDTMTAFYKENSFNRLTVTGNVHEWHKLPQNDTFYEGADFVEQGQTAKCNGTCVGAKLGDMMASVLDGADKSVDFRLFDNDGPDNKPNSGDDDGFVDFVAFVHPEMGGECSGAQNRNIWSHRWSYSGWKSAPYETLDVGQSGAKIMIEDYVVMPGLNCDNTSMIDIGVFAHEFGHAFGLPDLYDTDSSNGASQGIGNWCLMASGSWGGDGASPQRPSHMSAWAKSFLGWVQPRLVNKQTGDLTSFALKAVHDDKTAVLKVPISVTQYYLIEYRPKRGFDANLPIAGLLIWKINDTVVNAGLANNRVNAVASNKGVDLTEADGTNDLDRASNATPPGNRGDDKDPYPGATSNRRLDAKSNPKALGNIAVCDLGDPGQTITLSVFVSKTACQP
jgi:M6 family metalloprotease-like protein